ncbi:MAG: SMI1/KNR4 family protein [Cytophagia bacterium]|nr:SMI1/KNR4 family protein [Cytophagia bacterium]NBW38657.1 SMI1/KNR4 family protein [Cytophagia bacterium]
MNKQIIFDFVDNGLKSLEAMDMIRIVHNSMPQEMVDETKERRDDWIPWKPIKSTVTDSDLIEIEELAGRQLPDSYKEFLKYKHFYELDAPNTTDVVFFRHPIRDWKDEFVKYYSHNWVKERLIDNGYLPFAEHQDWGIVCFDTNRNKESREYPVVMIDHELIYSDPIPYEHFGDNFIDLIEKRLM